MSRCAGTQSGMNMALQAPQPFGRLRAGSEGCGLAVFRSRTVYGAVEDRVRCWLASIFMVGC